MSGKNDQIALTLDKTKRELYDEYRKLFPDLPQDYDLKRLAGIIQQKARKAAQGIVEIGKYLFIVSKMERGETFIKFAEELCGIGRSMAYGYIKIFKLTVEQKVEPKRLTEAGVHKVLMIARTSEDALEEFNNQGTIDGKLVTDMSVRELKELLKARQEQQEAELAHKDHELQERESQIEQLFREIRELKKENALLRKKIEQPDRTIIDEQHPAWPIFTRWIYYSKSLVDCLKHAPFTQEDEEVANRFLSILAEWNHRLTVAMIPISKRSGFEEAYSPEEAERYVQELNADPRFDFSKLDEEEG